MSVWTYAKRISKSTLAILVAVCALLLLCPVSPFPAAADTPEYMLKLDLSRDAERTDEHPLFTTVTGLEDGTYTFSFDYFSTAVPASGTSIYSVSWEAWQNAKRAGDHLSVGGVKTAQVQRDYVTTDANGGRMTMGIDFHGQVTGGVIYAWNFKLTKAGDTTNLLPNPDFKNGSLNSWNYAFTGWFEGTDPAPDPNGVCSAVAYDETLIGLDDGKTYMLKMDLDKAVSSGQGWSALNVSEFAGTDLSASEIPGTYTFSYDYYVQYSSGTGGIQNRVNSGGSVVTYGTLSAGRGTFSKTFTVTAENPTFSLQLMAAESKGGVAYFWNLKLTREGSSDNRLVNKSLRKGTLKGWRYVNQYGYIDDTATEKEYFSVEEYDNARTTLYGLGTSVRAGNKPGLRFGFTVANQGIDYVDPLNEIGTRTNYAGDLSQATVLVDGTAHRVLDMGVLVSVEEQAVLDRTAVAVKAKKLFAVQNGVATFTAVIVDIPENCLDTTIYACSFVEYETEEGSAILYGAVLSDSYNGALVRATA